MEVIMIAKRKFFSAKRVTGLAVLLALVIVLQLWGNNIKIGATGLSFVLVPIVLGGVLFGPSAGAFLGLVFGFITLMYGVTGADPFTAVLFAEHPFLTSAVCLVKGTAAGLAAGLLFRLIAKKNGYVGVFVASAAAPVVNTGLFILGALLMSDTLSANFVADGSTVLYFLIIGCAGINFLVELAINLMLSPAMYSVIRVVSGRKTQ
ncbi:MAG: ECF transporter S component [Clostridia bacterium]|nr:ECF transporter S component [Clostridia bacterium]